MNIKILIDREAPEFGGWKVMRQQRGNWSVAFRGTMDECHDWARSLADDLRTFARESAS